MKKKINKRLSSTSIKIVLLIIIVGIVGFALNRVDSMLYKSDVEVGYESLGLSDEFVLIEEKYMSTDGDLITSALEAESRIFKVSLNMLDTKNFLSEILTNGEDTRAYTSRFNDVRLSMHTEYLGLDDFIDNCSPAQIPIKAGNTFLTVILSNSIESASIEFDSDGHACGLNPPIGRCNVPRDYSRNDCTIDNKVTYVTFVVWNMD